MSVRDQLIRVLADGRCHSGSELSASLGVSRSAVWKQVHRLAGLGLEVRAEARRGYQLAASLELLDADRISSLLDPGTRSACEQLEVAAVMESTNSALLARPAPRAGMWRGALAEYQTGGRGRRGRRWLSPFGSGLCLSLGWSFAGAPANLPALSLAAGIGVTRALATAGATGLALKWPNDVVLGGRKVGGILVDVDGDSRGPLRAIVGVGLNLAAPAGLVRAVAADGGLAVGGLDSALPAGCAGRNALAAGVIGALCGVLREFAITGFATLADEWRRQDYLCGREVTVRNGAEETSGIARGVAPDGALLVAGPQGLATITNGDITLRPAA